MEERYDAIVVGSGHAGCEAALALARLNNKTLLTTLNLDSIAFLACNPSIGGTAKGQLATEIDALGGEMGVNADKNILQLRMLNRGKGVAVHSLRAQVDKHSYHSTMKQVLESQENLTIKQCEVVEILTEGNKTIGVKTAFGETVYADAVVLCTGVYLESRIIIGEYTNNQGPNGFTNSHGLSKSLENLGFEILRFKTGTPARVLNTSIDYSKFEVQPGDENIQTFSYLTKKQPKNTCVCYLGYTNEKTHEIIRNNISRAPMFSGTIKGVGPRYCPSMEDKVVRFSDKSRHQIFLEPEDSVGNEIYVQGFSSSMPVDVQEEMYKSVEGFENVQILRNAYAIEYDCINSLDLLPTLESKKIKGLFFAGQINGTSGYEEAGAQGIIAGINASNYLQNKEPLILRRDQGYIGVLIDDLVTKGTNEPYRMMTSRAEYRLLLRQDNADIRLTPIGIKVGLVSEERKKLFEKKLKQIEKVKKEISQSMDSKKVRAFFEKNEENFTNTSCVVKEMLKRTNITIEKVKEEFGLFKNIPENVLKYVETEVKYEGYLKRQNILIEQMKKNEDIKLDAEFDYSTIKGLRLEAQQKLNKFKPLSLGQASRISGVSPADISVLTVFLSMRKKQEENKN
ncbi:MAG: tRNA uridine-5-carboxymethylaminomethyl(34) synthesis enzyme MnmG [Clostridia bacterium]|nr:tRNA uridine-5-carboxymethylaminomethyl(34) synthesis enzyme MnmG [Clostridia bacterium]